MGRCTAAWHALCAAQLPPGRPPACRGAWRNRSRWDGRASAASAGAPGPRRCSPAAARSSWPPPPACTSGWGRCAPCDRRPARAAARAPRARRRDAPAARQPAAGRGGRGGAPGEPEGSLLGGVGGTAGPPVARGLRLPYTLPRCSARRGRVRVGVRLAAMGGVQQWCECAMCEGVETLSGSCVLFRFIAGSRPMNWRRVAVASGSQSVPTAAPWIDAKADLRLWVVAHIQRIL
jgi:hypothetical protein